MEPMEPVPWEQVIPVTGTPGVEVEPFVERRADEVAGEEPAVAVKTVYDDWKTELGDERGLSDQGAAYVIAYLLEHRGAIDPGEGSFEGSLVERRPDAELLEELVHEREETLWWIAVERGVHYSLVTRWCYESDVPLLRRNFTDETFEEIREQRAE